MRHRTRRKTNIEASDYVRLQRLFTRQPEAVLAHFKAVQINTLLELETYQRLLVDAPEQADHIRQIADAMGIQEGIAENASQKQKLGRDGGPGVDGAGNRVTCGAETDSCAGTGTDSVTATAFSPGEREEAAFAEDHAGESGTEPIGDDPCC